MVNLYRVGLWFLLHSFGFDAKNLQLYLKFGDTITLNLQLRNKCGSSGSCND